MLDTIKIITLFLSVATIPYAVHMLVASIASIRKNGLGGREKKAAYALAVLFGMIGLISIFNLVIQVLEIASVAGRHNVSVFRSLVTQIAAILTLYVYKKI